MVMLTDSAAQVVRQILVESAPATGLRVMVKPGGCAGLEYVLGLEEAPASDDQVQECGGVPLYIDPESAPILSSVTIDYVDSIGGGGFRFDNPNAVKSCSCGSSFTTQEGVSPSSCNRGQ